MKNKLLAEFFGTSWLVFGGCGSAVLAAKFFATEGSTLGSREHIEAWRQHIAHLEFEVLPGNAYHVAATHSDKAAQAALAFISRHSARSHG